MSCSCRSVLSGEGGISPRQMVDDVAPILSEQSCVLSTSTLPTLTTTLSSTCPSTPLKFAANQAKYHKLLIHRNVRYRECVHFQLGLAQQKSNRGNLGSAGRRTVQDIQHMTTSRTPSLACTGCKEGKLMQKPLWRNLQKLTTCDIGL